MSGFTSDRQGGLAPYSVIVCKEVNNLRGGMQQSSAAEENKSKEEQKKLLDTTSNNQLDDNYVSVEGRASVVNLDTSTK